ncbi:MAG: hypothetical protein E6J75_02085 [Deltaproteobacteria bacterium]|nr:MAG: hypothetical protein E6J75_02085 [Deltaproteobacteria bacterium]
MRIGAEDRFHLPADEDMLTVGERADAGGDAAGADHDRDARRGDHGPAVRGAWPARERDDRRGPTVPRRAPVGIEPHWRFVRLHATSLHHEYGRHRSRTFVDTILKEFCV